MLCFSQDAEWESGYYCYQSPINEKTEHKQIYANSTKFCDEIDFDWQSPPDECSGDAWGGYKYRPDDTDNEGNLLGKTGLDVKAPGFFKILPNRNGTSAAEIYATLYQSKFVDLQTRVVNIDMAFWNFNIERLVAVRFTFNLPLSGGVYPSAQAKVRRIESLLGILKPSDSLCSSHAFVGRRSLTCTPVISPPSTTSSFAGANTS